MEKLEKEIKYFIRLAEKMEGREIPESMMNRILKDTDKEFGINENTQLKKVEEIFGKNLEITEKDKTKLYKLSTEDEEEFNLLKSDIISFIKRRSLEEESDSSDVKKYYRVRKSFLIKFWNVLLILKNEKKDTFLFQEIKELCRLSAFNSQVYECWATSLKKEGIDLNLSTKVLGDSRRDKKVKFTNLKNLIVQVAGIINKKFPENKVDINKVLGLEKSSKVQPSIKKIAKEEMNEFRTRNITTTTDDNVSRSLVYLVAGILKISGENNVSVDDILKSLREGFQIVSTKKELLDNLKEEEYFEILNYGQAIKLKSEWRGWEEIKEKFGPQNFKKRLIVRLGMSEEEVKSIVPELDVKLISKISEEDGVYDIVYNLSAHHRKSLIRLYRTFRGNDKILNDEEMVELLKREICIIDGKSYKDDLAYNIENL